MELFDRRADPFGCGVPLARGDGLAGVADLAQTRGLIQGFAVQQLRILAGFGSRSVEFTVVILSEQVGSYPKINWTEWKDQNRKQMKSQGDVWSMATLSGATIWDCLDNNKIDRLHLVQWKPVDDTMYQERLPRRGEFVVAQLCYRHDHRRANPGVECCGERADDGPRGLSS